MSSAATASPSPVATLKANNTCTDIGDFFIVHVLIPIHFTKIPEPLPSDDNELWQLRCKSDKGTCTGAYLRFVADRPVDSTSFGPIDAKVVSRVGNVVTVQPDETISLVVDFDRGNVTYAESTPSTEGRGEVTCRVTKPGSTTHSGATK